MLKSTKRNHLSNQEVVAVANRVNQNPAEFNGKSAVKIAKQLTAELQFTVSPTNVRALSKALNITLRKSQAKRTSPRVADILTKMCREFGMKEDHPILQEIASLK